MDSSAFRRSLAEVPRVFITSHVDPDPDGLGCTLGLWHALRAAGWSSTPICIGHMPSFASRLPGHEALVPFPGRVEATRPDEGLLRAGDALIVVDTPTPTRMGAFFDVHRATLPECHVVVFDHHVTNEQYGELNFVDPSAAATAEVICEVLESSNIPLDASSATCFMAALLADTQTFRTESSSGRSLLWAYKLSSAGAPIFPIAEMLFKDRPLSALRLWGAALQRMRADKGVVWTAVTQAMLREAGAAMEDADGLVDFLLASRGTRAAIVLKEEGPGETKVSMRTAPGIDATRVTGAFGGGGHQRAAGCTISAPPQRAASLLLPLVFDELTRGDRL